MPAYAAPIADMLYLLGPLLGAETALATLDTEPCPLALMDDILSEAGRFCAETVQPLNRSGDEQGCRLENGVVRTPEGFPEAYAKFVAGGWPSLSHPPAHGGQGLPRALQLLLDEMLAAANFSFGLFAGLTRGAVEAIDAHADDALKSRYLPPMIEGRWTGAMALTEAHAGSDLGLLRSRAEPGPDGAWRITGTKIFISAGDHDLAENIIHLVLARLPDAPAGTRGISLFLVPKFLPDADGRPGLRNAMSPGGIEAKMGLHASPSCVMNYDGATGWLIGAPHRGLAAMFTMMNAERLYVGIQGLGIAEAAYQGAASYAQQRLQGRAPGSPPGPPQPILVHPDIRRMLLTIRAFTEAGRALAVWTALEMDSAAKHPDAARRAEAEALVALLTPVIKALFTDLGFEAAVLGQQVLGGHGYVRDWGMEQLVRDARVAQIYEGTNGIQAMDLLGRKILADRGAAAASFFALLHDTLAAAAAIPPAAPHAAALAAAALAAALARLETVTAGLLAETDPAAPAAAAADYLRLFGLTALGWMWLRMALLAAAGGPEATAQNRAKTAVASFFMTRILPQTAALAEAIAAGPAPVMALAEDAF